MNTTPTSEFCPGGCGHRCVGHSFGSTACRFCCNTCWDRLPLELRRDLLESHPDQCRVRHLLSLGDAHSWFQRNPPKTRAAAADADWFSNVGSVSSSGSEIFER